MLIVVALFFAISAFAKETVYQTLPNSTVRDYRAPAFVVESKDGKTTVRKTLPNSTVIDYTEPAFVCEKKCLRTN